MTEPAQRPPLVLAIESANPSIPSPSVAVARGVGAGGVVLAVEPIAPSTRERDDGVAAISRAVAAAGATPREIGLVAVSVGPGGYTAMRMAVAAARMVALATGARCVAVPSARSVALAVRESAPRGPFLVVLATKADTGFGAWFDPGPEGPVSGWTRLLRAAEIAGLDPLPSAIVVDPLAAGPFAQAAAAICVPLVPARADARSCLRAAAGLEMIEPDALVPLYAREPEAVTLWRARHGKGDRA